MKNIVFLTGAGISAESGLQTFRDADGYWNKYNVDDIATLNGLKKNPELVLNFYNQYRTLIKNSNPNKAHILISEYIKNNKQNNVSVITSNVDDMFEKAGINDVYHIHGEITMAKTFNKGFKEYIGYNDIKITDKGEDGSNLRPDIVFFGETPYYMEECAELVSNCDILVVIGTSLQVYPAAGLIDLLQPRSLGIILDPNANDFDLGSKWIRINKKATEGIEELIDML